MLPNENEPFADHHVAALETVIENLDSLLNNLPAGTSPEQVVADVRKLRDVQNALYRYKICFADEVRQKTLYRNRWMEIRFRK